MKKVFLLLTTLFLTGTVMFAQRIEGVGIVGGAGLSSVHTQGWKATSQVCYKGGVAYKYNLPYGFSIQPELLYHSKSAQLDETMAGTSLFSLGTTIGYLELPVQLQWGEEMENSRPYFYLEPYVGFGLNNKCSSNDKVVFNSWAKESTNIRRFEYGMAVGAGIEVWKLQIAAQYFMNIGSLCKSSGLKNNKDVLVSGAADAYEGKNFHGFELEIAFFF